MTWEERWHPLREEWVIVAAHRQDRPWSGETRVDEWSSLPEYVPDCYLCPGNSRVSGKTNPQYEQIFVFDNDHPSVEFAAPKPEEPPSSLYSVRPAHGVSRVVCYSPRHDLTLTELELSEIEKLMAVWQTEYADLGSRPEIEHVLIFENKGEAVGVSNPHPHCQIYANNFVFKTIENEARISKKYFAENRVTLFQEIIKTEKLDGRRIIAENDSAIAFLPFFARYAYEVFVAPKEPYPSIAALSSNEIADLSAVLKTVLIRFDNLWRMPFPYVMPLHQAPTDGRDHSSFHFHIEFHPPLRKPNLLKYLAGPEIGGGNFLSDTSPEEKAAELIAASDVHYKSEAKL
ncbi:MAG TPA: galactose-1-phosphate uridylyltransferase [Pyrinomonadaceae bacterium]|nr:galactose-1-phosphate uridylyltransferase [Pyrinomonadaceae bacterium]